jgi:hypothetical protein
MDIRNEGIGQGNRASIQMYVPLGARPGVVCSAVILKLSGADTEWERRCDACSRDMQKLCNNL